MMAAFQAIEKSGISSSCKDSKTRLRFQLQKNNYFGMMHIGSLQFWFWESMSLTLNISKRGFNVSYI